MLVTDKQYHMEPKLIKKFDLMIDRCTGNNKFDNVIIVDGDEGYGKTNLSVAGAYYMSWKTKRPFSVANIFFDPEKFIEFAGKTKEQIIVFDEAALIALASDWQNKMQKKMVKFLMAARKKKHIYFFNVPKFFRLNEYLVIDRAIALIHVYARREKELGRFVYFTKKKKNELYYEVKRSKRRNYKGFYNFHGTFPESLSKLIDEDKYEAMKDQVIANLSIDEKPLGKLDVFNMKLKYNLSTLPDKLGITKKELANKLSIRRQNFNEWASYKERHPELFEIPRELSNKTTI